MSTPSNADDPRSTPDLEEALRAIGESFGDFSIDEFISEISKELDLPPTLLAELLDDSDWAFVLKLHAIVEAAVTHQLVETTGDERLRSFYANLPLSNTVSGKIAIVRALGLMENWQVRYIGGLSRLRNFVAHDPKNINVDLGEYMSALPTNKVDEFARAFHMPDVPRGQDLIDSRQVIQTAPKFIIWLLGIFTLLDVACLKVEDARSQRTLMAMDAHLGSLVFEAVQKRKGSPPRTSQE